MGELFHNLKKKDFTLASPYKCSFDPSIGGYSFTSLSGQKYSLWFHKVPHFSDFPDISPYIDEFIFDDPLSLNTKAVYDKQIEETICYILKLYFEKNSENAIFFICDSSDKRHFSRHRLFNKWFINHYRLLKLEKLDSEVFIDGDCYLSSIIFLSTNPLKARIKDVFENLHHQYEK
jgi:hypothetical protein